MTEMSGEQTTIQGIIGLVLVLGGLGGGVFLTESEFENTYVCPLNEQVGIFHRLSGSEKTGYYYNEEGLEKRVACRVGRTYAPWITLNQYAKDNGIDPLAFIISKIEPENGEIPPPTEGKKWECFLPPIGCVEING